MAIGMAAAPPFWMIATQSRQLHLKPTPRPTRKRPAPRLSVVHNDPDERKCLAQMLAGNSETNRAEAAIYVKYRRPVLRVASSFQLDTDEVEDIVQDVFVRAFRALPALRDFNSFSGWLFTIARNRCRTYLASKKAHRQMATDASLEATNATDVEPNAAELLEREATMSCVRAVIRDLDEGAAKETVRLFYLEGNLCAREIAKLQGVGKSAITMRLERFRRGVRTRLLVECAK